MHTSFTGHARKSRQVNLSGRNVANPWAALPGSGGSTTPKQATGTLTTIAHAQADRLRRQHERDRQTAARKIQQIWRGHAVRRAQKDLWRQEWDRREQQRLSMQGTLHYHELLDRNLSYVNPEICLTQIRSLCRFANVRNKQDVARLLFLGKSLPLGHDYVEGSNLSQEWQLNLINLSHLVTATLELQTRQSPRPAEYLDTTTELLRMGASIVIRIPKQIPQESATQFRSLQTLLTASVGLEVLRSTISEFAETILTKSDANVLLTYKSFAEEMLQDVQIVLLPDLLSFFQDPLHQIRLCQAVSAIVTADLDQSGSVEKYLWMLSYLLYIRRDAEQDTASFRDWIQATSLLLSRCANEISIRLNEANDSPDIAGTIVCPLHPFIKDQISNLAQQQNIEGIVSRLQSATSERRTSSSDIAKPLANYAIALLRAFPEKALNIRMWLYRSSPASGTTSLSTIQYLWQAAQATGVFQKISREPRSVLSVLIEAAPEHNQIGRAQISAQEIAVWQEEWRLILLFIELYSFILKIMDDEEFFALDTARSFTPSRGVSQFSQGALPLSEVARMTTFLKNLAFPLYWNAADLADTNEIEEVGAISALFGTAPIESPRQVEKKPAKTLAGNGVSQVYMKERVTALLRMLHERDSRRRFLSESYWLMTNHVDMQGFIPAVVAEEERRHEVRGDTDEDHDAEDEDDEPNENDDSMALQAFNTMFGIRPPHIPRSRASRFDNRLNKRRERERRRRQAESLVPRIEILRNLPFFIPFDTRVQIFREFVYRDQYRRRNGWVDPDDWRYSIANSAQGRGLDGHPRGMELLGRHQAEIHRGSVFQDAYERFYEIGEALKEPIQISFIDRFGAAEAGIDGGGVTKEFLMSITNEAFDPNNDMPMFVENEQRLLYPNPRLFEWTHEALRRQEILGEEANFEMRELLRRYEFLGRIVGKCMYEGILVDLSFAGFFLLKWALTGGTTSATNETAYRASINDLRDYDETLYQGLLTLKNYMGDVEADFGLNFTASDEVEIEPEKRYIWTKDLIAKGANVAVTGGNRLLYIDKIARYRLQQQPAQVTNAFLKGLGQIIQPMWLAMFNQRELQKLVGGDSAELDILDLRRNTQYGGLYVIGDDGLEHPTVALFWKVLREMDDSDRRKVLKFVTSTPRAPLLGFSHLNPKFSIRDSSEDQARLPSTSTCVNLLKLPRYADEKTMREKLLYAVNAGAGFDLS